MVFQNRKDNFEEVYFLNGNIYPLSTLGRKKASQLLGLKTTWKIIKKACILSLILHVFFYMLMHMYMYACICVLKKKIKQNKSG